jgi:APA family basic amino acid/polyamine antiporter
MQEPIIATDVRAVPAEHAAGEAGASAARGGIGLFGATMLVIGNMIGSGVFLLPASLAKYGSVALLGWVLTGVGALLLALVFARLGHAIPATGGPYAYTRAAFGDFMGFWIAWGYWIGIWAGNAAIVVAGVGYISYFVPALHEQRLLTCVAAVAVIWLLTMVNAFGVRQGSLVTNVTTVVKLVILVGIAAAGLFMADWGNFLPFNPSGASFIGALGASATLTLWAFTGLESATVVGGEVRDAERTIGRATMLGTLAATAVYLIGTIAVMGAIPGHALAKSAFPFAAAAEHMFGGVGGAVVAAGAIVGTFGTANGWIMLQGQVPLAAATDELFPRRFKRSSRRGVPIFGLLVSSVLASVLVFFNAAGGGVAQAFTAIILLATLTILVPYAFSAGAQLYFLATDRTRFSGKRFGVSVVVAALAFAYSVWAIYGAGYKTVTLGFVLLLIGIPVYVWLKWNRGPRSGKRSA